LERALSQIGLSRSSVLAEALPPEERAVAAAILARCATVSLPAGTTRPGTGPLAGAALLIVEDGLVLLSSARAAASREVVCGLASAGNVLLPPGLEERLEALVDSELTVVTDEARLELLRLPGAADLLLQSLADALRDRQASLAAFARVRHADRVREKLLQLARAHGKVVRDGVRLDLPLTHELLGEMVGSARETVTWALAELSKEGFVRREGRSYRLIVPPDLLAS
jgi:CRP-like cAMP-binding protein